MQCTDWECETDLFLSCVLNDVCMGLFCFGRQLFSICSCEKKAHTNKVSGAVGRSQWGWADHQRLGCMGNVYATLMGWSCQLLPHSWEGWSRVIHLLGTVLWEVTLCWEYFGISWDAPTRNQNKKSNSQGLKKKTFFPVHYPRINKNISFWS